jgi:hypothetical protein
MNNFLSIRSLESKPVRDRLCYLLGLWLGENCDLPAARKVIKEILEVTSLTGLPSALTILTDKEMNAKT